MELGLKYITFFHDFYVVVGGGGGWGLACIFAYHGSSHSIWCIRRLQVF